jgi:hypothetical protein
MKGTLKLNSVAEEEKSKLVPEEGAEAALPPLVFLSAIAAAHRLLHVSGKPVPYHWPETSHPLASALPHLRTGAGVQELARQRPAIFT